MKRPHLAALGAAAAALAAHAATPAGMMANVYRLSEAAAVLTVCERSTAFRELPPAKAAQVEALSARLRTLAESVGRHYRDDSIAATFEATRARISEEVAMRGYVKTKYGYCGDALLDDMSAYVADNEKLIGGYFQRQALQPSERKPPPAPAKSKQITK